MPRDETKTWDPVWEEVFLANEWGKYPPEQLIRFTARSFYKVPDRFRIRFLEVGCGPGACIWYLTREGFQASGIDGSLTAIERAKKRLATENLAADLQVGDLGRLDEFYPPGSFDAVIDIAALQHNPPEAIERIVRHISRLLRPGGQFFSISLADGSLGQNIGTQVGERTWCNIPKGPLRDRGLCHFSTEEEWRYRLRTFADVQIEYELFSCENQQSVYKHWIVRATAPHAG